MATNTYKQFFDTEIEKQLRKDNAFLMEAKDISGFMNGSMVNMYYEGADPDTGVNIATGSLPLSITERVDGVFNYSIDELHTKPTLIRRNDSLKTPYDKVMSVKEQHAVTIAQLIAEYAIYNWLRDYAGTDGDTGADIPASAKLLTTGADSEVNNNPALDGLRKLTTLQDVQRVALAMDRNNIPSSGRIAVLSAQQYHELFDLSNTRYNVNSGGAQNTSGIVGELFGFKIYKRSTSALTTAGVVQAPGSAITTNSNHSSMFFHKDMVNKGSGNLDIYAQFDRGEYLGDLFNLRKDFASHRHSSDARGVFTLTQAPTV